MPMNKEVLGKAVMAAIDAIPEAERTDRERVFIEMMGALIDHLKNNIVITLQPTALGLQTTVSLGSPTGPPPAAVPLSAALGNITIT